MFTSHVYPRVRKGGRQESKARNAGLGGNYLGHSNVELRNRNERRRGGTELKTGRERRWEPTMGAAWEGLMGEFRQRVEVNRAVKGRVDRRGEAERGRRAGGRLG